MKNLACSLVLCSSTSIALADPAAPVEARRTLGVDAALVLPAGDYGEVATAGAGALGRLELPAGPGFVTGRAGVLLHAMEIGNLTLVPIYAGYRQPVGTGGLYVAGELGLTLGFGSVQTPFGMATASDSELGLTLGAGMRRGALDVRAALFLPDADDLVGLLGTVGFDFATL
jgi:hypothetical protein